MNNGNQIKSFRDLIVYGKSYELMLSVIKDIIIKLPPEEKYDLKDQLSRSSKAIPRLIAEGYAKRHQKSGFQKYLDDVMAESNETSAGLEQCKDLYPNYVDKELCKKLIGEYDILGRQIYKLRLSWNNLQNKTLK